MLNSPCPIRRAFESLLTHANMIEQKPTASPFERQSRQAAAKDLRDRVEAATERLSRLEALYDRWTPGPDSLERRARTIPISFVREPEPKIHERTYPEIVKALREAATFAASEGIRCGAEAMRDRIASVIGSIEQIQPIRNELVEAIYSVSIYSIEDAREVVLREKIGETL